jgi:hypothetical protein
VNPVASGVAALTLASYVLIYTPLKRRSSLATLVGAVPGALPPALRAAATEVDRLALSDEVRSPLARPPHSVELQREHAVLIATSPEQDGALGDDPAEQPASELWPPPEHPSVRWLDLSEMEREYVTVLLKAGKQAVREVHQLAKQARGRVTPNRHDKAAALSLDDRGLTEKVGRTGRRLIAVPREMPDRE